MFISANTWPPFQDSVDKARAEAGENKAPVKAPSAAGMKVVKAMNCEKILSRQFRGVADYFAEGFKAAELPEDSIGKMERAFHDHSMIIARCSLRIAGSFRNSRACTTCITPRRTWLAWPRSTPRATPPPR